MKRLSALLLAFLMLASLPLTVFAAGAVEMARSVRLTISYTYEETKLEDVEFKIYLISTMDEFGELTPTQDYAEYSNMLDIRGKNDAAWNAMTDVLNDLVKTSEDIKPTATATTDENGIASFGDGLEKGLYLVESVEHTKDGYIYTTRPFMVLLPGRDAATDEWIYDVFVSPKKDKRPVVADYTVKKEWVDYGEESNRPASITVQLLCDGEAEGDPIQLPHKGNWSYTWEDLDVNHDWSVEEAEVKGYTSEVEIEGNIIYLTNTLNKPKLPQTGQLNWPVPALAVGGLAVFTLGWILRYGKKKEEYET